MLGSFRSFPKKYKMICLLVCESFVTIKCWTFEQVVEQPLRQKDAQWGIWWENLLKTIDDNLIHQNLKTIPHNQKVVYPSSSKLAKLSAVSLLRIPEWCPTSHAGQSNGKRSNATKINTMSSGRGTFNLAPTRKTRRIQKTLFVLFFLGIIEDTLMKFVMLL